MNKKLFGTVIAAAVMLAGTIESYGGEKMSNELLTVKETAIVDLGAAVARGDQPSRLRTSTSSTTEQSRPVTTHMNLKMS